MQKKNMQHKHNTSLRAHNTKRIFIKFSIQHSNSFHVINFGIIEKTNSDFIPAHSKTSDLILVFICVFLISITKNYLKIYNDINTNLI